MESIEQMLNHNARNGSAAAAEAIVRWRWVLALVGAISFAACYPVSLNLGFDRRIESLFAPDDPDLLAYRELKESFGGNAVVLLVYVDQSLASSDGIERNRQLTEEIKNLEGVTGVLSTSRLSDAIQKFRPTLVKSDIPNLFRKDDPVAEGFDEIFAGYTHSSNHTRAAVVALLAPDHPSSTITRLQAIAKSIPARLATDSDRDSNSGEGVVVGEPVLIHDGLALVERDGAKLATITIVLLSIVVVISLADARFVILTAVTILWSVVVTRAAMVALNIELSLVSSVLTAIVTVISVTAVLHLGVRFRASRWRGIDQRHAVIDAFHRLLRPIFWTCATDAAGFAALGVSRIAPIREFGVMIAVSALAVCVALVLFSGAAMMLPSFGRGSRSGSYARRVSQSLRRGCLVVASTSISRSFSVVSLGLVASAMACFGVGRIETDTSFLNNFRAGSPIAAAYREVETNFGGAGVWDIVLDAPSEMTSDFLNQVRLLEDDLRQIDVEGARLSKVLSIADAERVVARARFADLLPAASRLSAMYVVLPGFFDALLTPAEGGTRKLRIMLRSQEQLGSQQKEGLIAEVQRIVSDHTTSSTWSDAVGLKQEGRVTGYHVLMARLIGQLIGDQWRCFAASALLVFALLVIATRSFKLALAALIPNILPILLVLSCVGMIGGKINMGAAMIAAVSIGISIDGSVHLLLSYRRYRSHGHSVRKSTIMAAAGVGVPVLLATVALILGFGVLATSEFVPTATFGLLVAFTLAIGTLVNLTLLPALLTLIEQRPTSRVADRRPVV